MKLNNKVFLILFLLIFSLGGFLRFYQLGSIPNAMDWDEVSWGYNAYSVLHTGKDEFGEFLPMSFRAFGDYKQPFYVYASLLPISLFDLTPFATRFPSAFFGTLTILVVYLFTFEIFRKERYVRTVALLSMAFFAISPWSIHFSRVAFEANIGLFFVILGSWLFIRGLHRKKNAYFFLGAIALAISAYTYHSDKLFAPALFVLLLLYGWRYFFSRKVLVISLIGVFTLCNLFWIVDSRTTARGKGVLFTGNPTPLYGNSLRQLSYDLQEGDHVGEIVHNWRLVVVQKYVSNYFEHFNPNWLFMDGDNQRHHTPTMGMLYFANVLFILLGMVYLIREKPKTSWILFAWLFMAPAASALAVDAPNASRSLIFLPTWHIFEAFGWWYAYKLLKKPSLRLVLVFPLLLLLLNITYFIHQYFAHTNTDAQKDWQYGYKEVIEATATTKEKIVFSSHFEQPYIFYLFYKKYDPKKYLESGGSERLSQKCYTIDNAYFNDCKYKLESGDMYLTTGDESIPEGRNIKQFNYANGETAATVYKYE